MPKNLTMLITGASGLLGGTLVDVYRSYYSVVGLFLTHPIAVPKTQMRNGNILDPFSLKNIFYEARPDVVIHCASLTSVDDCESNPVMAEKVNVVGTRNVVDASNFIGAKLIYISTDSVYGGDAGNYSENDLTDPQNVYGQTKLKGEAEAMKGRDALILRTNIFGWNIIEKTSLSEWILYNLQNGNAVKGFTDAIFSSIYTYEIAKIIEISLERNLAGIFNCGSRNFCSKYEFAKKIASRFGFDSKLIQPSSIEKSDLLAKRGKTLSMNVSRIETILGCKLPTIDYCLDKFYQDYHFKVSERIKQWRI